MSKKIIYLVSVILVLGSVNNAEEIFWSDGAADHNHLWTDPDNWLGGVVPRLGDEAQILSPEADAGHGPIIQDGMDIKLVGIKNELAGRPGKPELTMTGGNLELTDFVWWGDYDNIEAYWYHSGGNVTVANEFELGWGPGTGGAGTLDMTGGTISAGELVIPTGSGAYGNFYLRGGTFNVRNLGGLEINANGLIDVSGGTLVLEGDQTAMINDFIDAGQIIAYAGGGLIDLDYDNRNPGKTTLTARWTGQAYAPEPADGAVLRDTWASLGWSADDSAVSHDVYFGDNFDDVEAGTGDTFQGNHIPTFFVVGFPGFAYPDGLVPGMTYYWRIDEVNESEPNSPWKGDVWSFTIASKTAFNPNPADGAEFVNPDTVLSWEIGFGAKLHTVYFGDNFDDVNNATGGSPAGATTYTPDALELGKVYYWRVDEFDAVDTHKGEVWSFTTEGAVATLKPSNGAVDVKQTQILSWLPSDNAASHQVYFGVDKEAVRSANTDSPEYKGTRALGAESYDPGKLEWDMTYYWRIDEVNNTNPNSPWIGPVWSFTTADFLLVDDFEDYDAGENQIWYAWRDGLGYGTAGTDPYYAGNGSGSAVGDENTPSYTEETIVHRGSKAMPLAYDNNKQGFFNYSEAVLTLTYPRDWTENGVNRLTIWFRGDSANDAEPMYVALNDSVIVTHENPDAAKVDEWTEWNIDLQAFADQGVNLANVFTLALGFGDKNNPLAGGAGKMYFDDIRLYVAESEVP